MALSAPIIARRSTFEISTDPARLDRDAIYSFLSTCYWSPGIAAGDACATGK